MKHIIISPHSFVDLITNSSSELFICDTKKSIDSVKEIVIELVKITNQKLKLKDQHAYDISSVFGTMFYAPEVFQYTFPYSVERDDYMKLESYDSQRNNPVFEECLSKSYEWGRKNPAPKFPKYTYPNYPTEEEQIPYKEENKIYLPKRESAMAIIWKPFCDLHHVAYSKCLKRYCELNEIEFEDTLPSEHQHVYIKEGKHKKFIEEFEESISWDYIVKKGDIILRSCNDNSVPYELFEDLEDILNAQRIHLG